MSGENVPQRIASIEERLNRAYQDAHVAYDTARRITQAGFASGNHDVIAAGQDEQLTAFSRMVTVLARRAIISSGISEQ